VRYSYYPGCSAHSTGLEYTLSTEATLSHLGVELEEIQGWNCCGASSAHALSHRLALTLPARNLALAQQAGGDLVIPCAACYNRLKGADLALRGNPKARAEIQADVGFEYTGQVRIRPLLAILHEDFGPERVAAETRRPLAGLKVVPYYGCLLVRPPRVAEFDNPDDPHVMADLLRAAGAEVMPWSHATDCCGAGLSLPRSDAVYRLVGRLAERAREAGAEALVTACPLCQVNLEMRQPAAPRLPAFYFTELLGLAFDLPEAGRWWPKHLIDPRPLLRSHSLVA
jgi:heterodisulfide reductase subunit B